MPEYTGLATGEDEELVLTVTEVEDLAVEQDAWEFGLRDLQNGRIDTENKLALLTDQQYSHSLASSSKQAFNMMKQELIHLKIQFITNVKENFEKIYLWRLHKIYQKLVKDVLDCTYDRQVIARSQVAEVQSNFAAAVAHARKASTELEQALQALVEMASNTEKLGSHATKDSKETVAYFGNKKTSGALLAHLAPSGIHVSGDTDERPS